MTNCIFCDIAAGKRNVNLLYENHKIMCFLDIEPINEGHILIIPRKHLLDLDELDDELIMEIMLFSKKMLKILKKIYNPQGYSIMQNGGKFNDIGHYHLHLFPRYDNDGFSWNADINKTSLEIVKEKIKKELED